MIRIYLGAVAVMLAAVAAGAQTADDPQGAAAPVPPADAAPAPPTEPATTTAPEAPTTDPARDPMTLNQLRDHYDARFADYEARFLDYDLRLESLQRRIARLEADPSGSQSSDAASEAETPQVPTAQ